MILFFMPLYYKYIKGIPVEFNTTLIISAFVPIIILNIPTILIYLNYYFENKNTSLVFDSESEQIKISKNGIIKKYDLNDVESSTYNIGKYYQNALDNVGRWSVLHSDLGYWDLRFKNGDRFFLTNLLCDFLHDKALVKNTKYRFRLFPFIDKTINNKGIEYKPIKTQTISRKEKLKETYKNKTEEELNYILENKSEFQEEAIIVAEQLLKEKNVG